MYVFTLTMQTNLSTWIRSAGLVMFESSFIAIFGVCGFILLHICMSISNKNGYVISVLHL